MSRKQLGVRIGERASVESWYLLELANDEREYDKLFSRGPYEGMN
jgi:hypothetical protein